MIKRSVLLGLGIVSLLLGMAGIVLPLLPTVPFVLLAGFCFARSSPALHHWLHQHPWFAQALNDWHQQRGLRLPLKRRALLMTLASFSLSIWLVSWGWLKLLLAIICMILIIFLWRLPVIPATEKATAYRAE
ncbi:YbaN family protein [Shewanella dokdonensis]|uniref:Inner membrane protein n=1 Tax=Shewanella dokdonensis TaxID=712036 RepID=A0ABX8DFR9_9GAMM|nr:YbaN family protein [Shewanella dokdonensis]MCL1075176.1 YbaN family protein [Shewanella dokdonensis]QVK23560.1 YbaN family protein [Shewanella dokdonensis]